MPPLEPPLVFLGPTLDLKAARAILTAEYRPPIRRGDLPALAGLNPRTVCIIDGVFFQHLAVTPDEILETLAWGHHVIGAASMGALRAAELWRFGMHGVGAVFEAYRDGQVERDDEVAVVFEEGTFRPFSHALIAMRRGFHAARIAGLLGSGECEAAIRLAAELHYSQRTYPAVVRALELPAERARRLQAFLLDDVADLKAEDAVAALSRVARDETSPAGRQRPPLPASPAPQRLRLTPRGIGSLADLPPALKCPGETSVRSRDAAATDRLLRRLGPEMGITRVADVTQLDTLGIPCFTAVRPGPGTSVYSGKSLDPIDARVGAQMEAIETAVAFGHPPAVCHGPFEVAAHHGPALDPALLAIGNTVPTDPRAYADDWVVGHDLHSGDPVLVPAAAVYLGHRNPPPWYASSNGLASGNNLTEAIAHALAEIIERDALCLHDLAVAPEASRAFLRVLATPPLSRCLPRLPGVRKAGDFANIDLASLPPRLLALCQRAQASGTRLHLRAITSDISVPVFACLMHQPSGAGVMKHVGSGCHPDAAVAARRAITEAAQCRATYIQGAREDLPEPAIAEAGVVEDYWFDGPLRDFASLPSHSFTDVRDDVVFMLGRLSAAGLHRVLAADLGDPGWPIAIARVIVCGAEPPLEMDGAAGPWMGWRARSALGLSAGAA